MMYQLSPIYLIICFTWLVRPIYFLSPNIYCKFCDLFPSTSFHSLRTFTFLMLDSNGTPLSGSQSLNLLKENGALKKLQDLGYLVSNFSLVVPISTIYAKPLPFTSLIQGRRILYYLECDFT